MIFNRHKRSTFISRSCELTFLLLTSAPAYSVIGIAPMVAVTKTFAKKVVNKFISWIRITASAKKPPSLSNDIWLTVSNGGERFILFAKNPTHINKGLTARAGSNIKAITCSAELTQLEKYKVLNGIKAKSYLSEAGGIAAYKSQSQEKRRALRSAATNKINDLIYESGCSTVKLRKVAT